MTRLYYFRRIVSSVMDIDTFVINGCYSIFNGCVSCNVCGLYLVCCNDVIVYTYFWGTYCDSK